MSSEKNKVKKKLKSDFFLGGRGGKDVGWRSGGLGSKFFFFTRGGGSGEGVYGRLGCLENGGRFFFFLGGGGGLIFGGF